MTKNYIPEICPLGKESSIVRCTQCCYMEQNKRIDTIWCRADRIEKGLPEMR